jgi:general stress protein 26
MTLTFFVAAVLAAQTAAPTRAQIIAGARDVVQKARYCTFVTIGHDGYPQARIVDPLLAAEGDPVVWIATNPLTRKVREIAGDPRATVLCFDTSTLSYATIVGRATIVDDAAERSRRWKPEWDAHYPMRDGQREFTLMRVAPARLEIVSPARGLVGDPRTWLPLSIDFR